MDYYLMILLSGVMCFFGTLIGAFAGGGSSLITFPLLLLFAPGSYISLFIVSKIAAVMMTISSGGVHLSKGALNMKLFMVILVSGILGTAIGTYFLQYHFDEVLFKRLLTIALFSIAAYLGFSKKRGLESSHMKSLTLRNLFWVALFSFAINILNGLFGGTGIFVTAFLVAFLRMNFIAAIAYTMVTYAVISILQTGYLAMINDFDPYLAIVVLIFALLGGYAGVKLQYLKGDFWVKRAAIFMMLAIGVRMLF